MKRNGKSKFIGKRQRNRLSLSLYEQNEYRVTSTNAIVILFWQLRIFNSDSENENAPHIISFILCLWVGVLLLLCLFSFSYHFPLADTKTRLHQLTWTLFSPFCCCVRFAICMPPFVTVFVLICFCFCHIFYRWLAAFFLTPVVCSLCKLYDIFFLLWNLLHFDALRVF